MLLHHNGVRARWNMRAGKYTGGCAGRKRLRVDARRNAKAQGQRGRLARPVIVLKGIAIHGAVVSGRNIDRRNDILRENAPQGAGQGHGLGLNQRPGLLQQGRDSLVNAEHYSAPAPVCPTKLQGR